MIELNTDFWTYPSDYKCITTNGVVTSKGLVMGTGVALKAKQLFPSLSKKLGALVKLYGNQPFLLEEEKIISFPTKHHWKGKSCLSLIVFSAKRIVKICKTFNVITLTRPGCGNGGLDWEEVKDNIKNILDDRFIVCEQ